MAFFRASKLQRNGQTPTFRGVNHDALGTGINQTPEAVKQLRYDEAYMRMAAEWAQLSHCVRKQVGALIVKDRMIIADGFNGTPTGFPNVC